MNAHLIDLRSAHIRRAYDACVRRDRGSVGGGVGDRAFEAEEGDPGFFRRGADDAAEDGGADGREEGGGGDACWEARGGLGVGSAGCWLGGAAEDREGWAGGGWVDADEADDGCSELAVMAEMGPGAREVGGYGAEGLPWEGYPGHRVLQ